MSKYYSLPEAVALTGQTYDRVYYAVLKGEVKPRKIGRIRLLTDRQIDQLKAYFAGKGAAC